MNFNQELLLIDKPKGITSFDVIRRLRRRYTEAHNGARAPKMGHAGTLDPLASGLLLIGIGDGTKRLAQLIKLNKEYIAEICLGESRTTGDLEGEVVEVVVVDESAAARLQRNLAAALSSLRGTHSFPVSAYSAIKVDGVPMYKRAREAALTGDTIIDVPVRSMTVSAVELLDVDYRDERLYATVRFAVASGTYIRSLAEALGQQLGYPACLSDLRRMQVGEYRVEQATKL